MPSLFKAAYITPLLKKSDLDSADVLSYRPISNLSVLSKLLERLVARQLLDHLAAAKLLPEHCSRLTERTIPQKLQSSRFWQMSCLHWILAMLLY